MGTEHLKDYIGSEQHIDNILKARLLAVEVQQQKKHGRIEKYNADPNRCKQCGSPIEYSKRRNSFCSNSCAATFNNIQRGPRSEETKDKIAVALLKYKSEDKHPNVKYSVCEGCGIEMPYNRGGHKPKHCKTCQERNRILLRSSPEYRKMRSEVHKKSYQEGRSKGWASRDRMKPSYPEQYFMNMFERDEIEYEREIKIGRYFADFVFENKTVLEIDGNQHDREPYRSSDIRKDQFLKEQGYKVIRIRWKNINTDDGYRSIQEEYKRFKEIILSVG